MATQGAAREVEMTQEEVDGEIHRIFDGESDESEFEGFDVGSSEDDDSDLQGSDEDDEEQPRVWNWRTVTADNDTANASAWLPGVTRQRGPTAQADENISPADCFAMMFTDEAVDIAVTQTNLYAQRKLEALGAHFPSSRMRKWHDISSREIESVFRTLARHEHRGATSAGRPLDDGLALPDTRLCQGYVQESFPTDPVVPSFRG